MNFTALDFETANWYRRSACSIGMVRVEDGKVIDEYYALIRPEPFWFHPINSNIHGLSEDQCRNERTFDMLWPIIKEWIDGQIIVGHNVSFERSVINHLFDTYEIEGFVDDYLCSMYLSRMAFPGLPSYRLPYVYYKMFDKPFVGHHNALEDAKASADIVMKVVNEWRPPTFKGMIKALYLESTKNRVNPKRKVSLGELTPDPGFEENKRLKGKTFAFTGSQNCFTKEEAAQWVVNNGGKVADNVSKNITTLVVGKYRPNYGPEHESSKYKRVKELIEQGCRIEILTEDEFLELTKN